MALDLTKRRTGKSTNTVPLGSCGGLGLQYSSVRRVRLNVFFSFIRTELTLIGTQFVETPASHSGDVKVSFALTD